MMFARLLLLFLITPIVELALLIRVGMWIGYWETIAIIAVTAVAGSYLAKREGLSVWRRFNDKLAHGGLPGQELVDGLIILVAGALLITPGVLTDAVGFIGLIPFTRKYIRKYVYKRLQEKTRQGATGFYYQSVSGFDQRSHGASENTASEGDNLEWGGESRTIPEHDQEKKPTDSEQEEKDPS